MVFVVTFVGFLIHVYSVGYMAHEEGYQRYFAYLNLFMGAMLLLVLGDNFLVMFVGWEGVGLCSYLLIGYYYDQEFAADAGRKAFIVNRIGDFAFLLGLFALVAQFGTLDYETIFSAVAADPHRFQEPAIAGMSVVGFVALMLFVGAMGKSAQIPLYVWLPDAMAGPTPVSALIHAATMVTAGVYMVVRSNVIYQLAPGVSGFVALVGAVTAIFAATIGLAQTDIKKVLAYSTVSQLGYMFLAAGVGAYTTAIFHLGTHAFFKALLFLGSGSVIHAMGGEQDMRKMGGLARALPWTWWTFLVGTLAISGVPGLSGFFSKDQILAAAFEARPILWAVGLVTAGLTAFYMFRALLLTFTGSFRGTDEQREHLHESPPVMTVPLAILAVGAALAGWIGIPRLGHFDYNLFDRFLSPVVARVGGHGAAGEEHHLSLALELGLMALSVAVAGLGIFLAWRIYGAGRGLAGGEAWARRYPALHRLLVNKYWVDEAYDRHGRTRREGSRALAAGTRSDAKVVDGVGVNGTRHVVVAQAALSQSFRQVRGGRSGEPDRDGPPGRHASRPAPAARQRVAATPSCWPSGCSSWSASSFCSAGAEAPDLDRSHRGDDMLDWAHTLPILAMVCYPTAGRRGGAPRSSGRASDGVDRPALRHWPSAGPGAGPGPRRRGSPVDDDDLRARRASWPPTCRAQRRLDPEAIGAQLLRARTWTASRCLLVVLTDHCFLGFLASSSAARGAAIQRSGSVSTTAFSMLLQTTGMLGVFMTALDLFVFYVFWEVMLVPMYFLIGIWGGPRKLYAAIKFFLYTLVGSVLMLLGILALYFFNGDGLLAWPGLGGDATFSVLRFHEIASQIPPDLQFWIFLAFFVGFAIKVPMIPFHTWLPDAHVEAPTAGSVILAGVLLKMGTYGFVRFSLPILPEATRELLPWMIGLSIGGILYGALVAMAQKDVKKLVAYSSVSHLGFVMLGIFALNPAGLNGGILQMINHGLSTGALFLLVGILYERRHTRLISEFGGLSKVMPAYATVFLIITMASIGLPTLNGFIGEFTILVGVFERSWVWAALAAFGIVLGAAYMLWMYQRVFFGPVRHEENQGLRDLNGRELACVLPLVVLCFWIGLYPKPFFEILEQPVEYIVQRVDPGYAEALAAARPGELPAVVAGSGE